jgi:hypothetical protein
MSNIITIKGPVYDCDDYTFYLSGREAKRLAKTLIPHDAKAWDTDITIIDQGVLRARDAPSIVGRANICSCRRGMSYSITIRKSKFIGRPQAQYEPKLPKNFRTGFELDETPFHHKNHLVPVSKLRDVLADRIFKVHSPLSGLVVVSGSTASAKSTIVRGLIDRYLKSFQRGNRRPHLVTYEDPIEKSFIPHLADDHKECEGFDYTPREREFDVSSLQDALSDAKRQTPCVFYIGEIRDASDWPAVLDFAGSGHLVITTSHAGSLIEAMEQLLNQKSTVTNRGNEYVAQRLLAVVHLTNIRLSDDNTALVPTLWRRTDVGIKALVSDGLSSVLPHCPDDDENSYALGRHWFAREFRKMPEERANTHLNQLLEEMVHEAYHLDLLGR